MNKFFIKNNKKLILFILSTFLLTACSSESNLKETVNKVQEITTNNNDINSSNSDNINPELQEATFVRAVDGDTIKVLIEDEKYTIRMIGINTPESVHPDETKNNEYGVMASDFTKKMFKENQTIYLEKDVSNTDKYDRLLRYVWLSPTENLDDENEIETKMYNAICVKEGFANSVRYGKDTKHADIFDKLEKSAYENKRGLWGIEGNTLEPKETKEETPTETTYIGNVNSKKFHRPSCKGLPAKENQVYFSSRDDAVKGGYIPCKTCNP